MKKKQILYLVVGVTIILFGVIGFVVSKKPADPEKVHYHAGFVVFENGKKLNFSDNKYMFIKPCTIDGEEIENPGDEQIEKAHLHDNVGDVIHIEEEGAIWRDLFTNINFPVDYSKVEAYINGEIVPNFESQSIKSNDSLVLFFGSVDKSLLSQAPTKEYIEEWGKKSSTCGD
ncbi:MAG: hypothetical protein AAB622_02125 [Patescibacteria group bacterium]